jgi:peptide/nickel transport system substrate-binding protein
MVMRRVGFGGVVLLVAALLAAACGGGGSDDEGSSDSTSDAGNTDITAESSGEPQPGGTIAYGLNAETTGWDASTAQWAGSGYIVASAIFDRLMAYDEDGNVAPYLAESMTPNEDFTSWTIALRDGVTFHDGSTLDAEVLKNNIDTHRASFLTGATMRAIEEVRVEGDEVVVDMNEPWSTFPHLLTAQPGYVMAQAMLDDLDKGNLEPIGTGPFQFRSWAQDSNLVVERYDDYWRDGFPYLDGIEFRIITDNVARTQSLTSGEIDMLETGDARQIVELTEMAENGELQMFVDREGETTETFIAFNTSQPPFDDPIARQAVAYGVDTQTLADTQFEGIFEPARGMFKENSPWYTETDYPTFDPEKARELVAQYEAEHGEPLAFEANITGQPEIQAIAQFLQQQMAEVGIDVQLVTLEQTQLILQALGGDYEATGFILFGSAHPDRESVFLDGANASGTTALAITRNDNPAINAAIEATRGTDDPDEQIAQYAIIQEEMAEDLAFVFLVHNESGTASSNAVRAVHEWTLPDGTPGTDREGVIHPFYQVWLER